MIWRFIANYPPVGYPRAAMQLTINVPDFLLDDVRNKLAAQPTGILEAVALDAILGYLDRLRKERSSNQNANERHE